MGKLLAKLQSSAIAAGCVAMLIGVTTPATLQLANGNEPSRQEKETEQRHWSFQSLRRTAPPAVADSAWPRTAVDRFVLAKLEAAGLSPMPAADRHTLIRRLYYDLIGLPPTPADVRQFTFDSSPDAYERLVDRLLANPEYGERWGQHWLDLARFAETDGFEHDKVRPQAWRYRDWVIESLRRDVPYDEFVRQQLAGDEQNPKDPAAVVATGFCLCGPDMPDINVQEERRHMVLNELTATVGSVFLGLQMECAQCHDHKFDPIRQADFYALRSFFEHADLFREQKIGRVMCESAGPFKPSFVMIRGDFRRPGEPVRPQYPPIADPWKTPPSFEREGQPGGRRTAFAQWLTRPDHPLFTRVIVNRIWQHHFGEGLVRTPSDFGLAGDVPLHRELLDWLAIELPRLRWSLKSLHRLLVTSATYRQASRPSGGALSTWKRNIEADSENRLLGRMARRRLDGETIRDTMLAISGRLSQRSGGPGIMAPLPRELEQSLLEGHWKTSADEEDHRRRSIYLFVRRNLRYPMFDVFDRPDTNASCPQRPRSTIAPQALTLLNSDFPLETARYLAGSLLAGDLRNDQGRVADLFLIAFGRPPAADEVGRVTSFVHLQAESLEQDHRKADTLAVPIPRPVSIRPCAAAAWTDAALAVLNASEFIYVD